MTQQPIQQPTTQAQTGRQTGGRQSQQGVVAEPQQQAQFQQTGRSQQMQQPMGLRFDQGVPQETQNALHSIVEAIKVCEWCADQCLDEGPQMAQCIRNCRDVTEIGTTAVQLLSRNSAYAHEFASQFVTAAEACAQECEQHGHAHCQDCADKLNQAIMSVKQLQNTGYTHQSGQL